MMCLVYKDNIFKVDPTDNHWNFEEIGLQLETLDEAEEQGEQMHAELIVQSHKVTRKRTKYWIVTVQV